MSIQQTSIRPPLEDLVAASRILALLLAASALHALEAMLPSPGPWFKPGLANIVTLLALVLYGPRAALIVAAGRVVIGAFVIGTLFTPTFVISLGAGLAALAVMLAAHRLLPGLSLVGISLLGGIAHMSAQFAIVETMFLQQPAIYTLLPPLLLVAAGTGWLNGAIAGYIVARMP